MPNKLHPYPRITRRPPFAKRPTRSQVLAIAAYAQIAERGIDGLNLREVAARANVAAPTLFYHYKTKNDLICGVVDYLVFAVTRASEPRPDAGAETPSAAQAWHSYLRACRDQFVHAHTAVRVFCELYLYAHRNEAVMAAIRHVDNDWQAYLERVLMAGVQSGEFRPDLNPRTTAQLVMSCIKGLALRLDPPADADAMFDQLERLILK
jgi:AcrR family transcriptional regulator